MAVIEIRGLRKSFKETIALAGIDLTVERGEMFGIVGPDGAGKTTLIRTLCGILSPDEGAASILSFDLETQVAEIKPKIGYLSQRFSLYPDLSIDENIEFFAEIHEVKDYDRRRNELLEFTRLAPFRSRLADQLSGGMKQKLALACTLIHRPEIIFLDEPTTGVDPVSRRDFWKILSSLLKDGITIVMTTPYLDEAERCTRVAMMDHGRILVADTPRALKEGMAGEIFEIVTPRAREALRMLREHGEDQVQLFGDRLNIITNQPNSEQKLREFFAGQKLEYQSMRKVPPSLENVFISLLKREEQPGDTTV